ncbi:PREDICTED: uncharacterized protein LOC101618604, partial [Condylura cristata]|uniref:uncharacterized protein LOC101618604 n=1 Tax=Condylura cristata TaxID=143302 RepID=UPI00033465F6
MPRHPVKTAERPSTRLERAASPDVRGRRESEQTKYQKIEIGCRKPHEGECGRWRVADGPPSLPALCALPLARAAPTHGAAAFPGQLSRRGSRPRSRVFLFHAEAPGPVSLGSEPGQAFAPLASVADTCGLKVLWGGGGRGARWRGAADGARELTLREGRWPGQDMRPHRDSGGLSSHNLQAPACLPHAPHLPLLKKLCEDDPFARASSHAVLALRVISLAHTSAVSGRAQAPAPADLCASTAGRQQGGLSRGAEPRSRGRAAAPGVLQGRGAARSWPVWTPAQARGALAGRTGPRPHSPPRDPSLPCLAAPLRPLCEPTRGLGPKRNTARGRSPTAQVGSWSAGGHRVALARSGVRSRQPGGGSDSTPELGSAEARYGLTAGAPTRAHLALGQTRPRALSCVSAGGARRQALSSVGAGAHGAQGKGRGRTAQAQLRPGNRLGETLRGPARFGKQRTRRRGRPGARPGRRWDRGAAWGGGRG